MANILKASYIGDNIQQNIRVCDLVVTLDDDIELDEVQDYLPNNENKHLFLNITTYLHTNSCATLFTPSRMYICKFVAEYSPAGVWKVLGSAAFEN